MDDPFVRRARLVRVVDGDTQIFDLDLGYACTARHSIRLLGVDCPEMFSGPEDERVRGRAARDFAVWWFEAHAIHAALAEEDWPFVVRSEKDTTTFGRYLGEIRGRAGHGLAEALVAGGHAKEAP